MVEITQSNTTQIVSCLEDLVSNNPERPVILEFKGGTRLETSAFTSLSRDDTGAAVSLLVGGFAEKPVEFRISDIRDILMPVENEALRAHLKDDAVTSSPFERLAFSKT